MYGLMREAWEQATTEVLLNDVVERYRVSIETQKVRVLHDITEEDCATIEDNMGVVFPLDARARSSSGRRHAVPTTRRIKAQHRQPGKLGEFRTEAQELRRIKPNFESRRGVGGWT